MGANLLDSEQMYVDLFARTGKWRVQKLPRIAVEEGLRQRALHKTHRANGGDRDECPCSGCIRQRNGFELVLDFASPFMQSASNRVQDTSMQDASNRVQDTSMQNATNTVQSTRDPLDEKERSKKKR